MTKAEILAAIDLAEDELRQTTVGYVSGKKGTGCYHSWTVPPAGTHWDNGLNALAKARAAVAALPDNPPPALGLPRFWMSTGANPTNAVLDLCRDIGMEGVRFDYSNHSTADIARTQRVIANGQQPLLITPKKTPAGLGRTIGAYWKDRLKMRCYDLGNEWDLNGWTAKTGAPIIKQWSDEILSVDPGAILGCPSTHKGHDIAGNTPPDWARELCAVDCRFHVWFGHYFDDDPGWDDPRNGWRYNAQVRAILDQNGRADVPVASSESHPFVRNGLIAQNNDAIRYLEYAATGTLASVALYRMDWSQADAADNLDSAFLDQNGFKRPVWEVVHDYLLVHAA